MRRIELSGGKYARIDESDFTYLNQWKWHRTAADYAVRNLPREGKKRRVIFMHREIIGAPEELEVDHINGDRLDNRRTNLRVCTRAQNMANSPAMRNNTSGYKGVHLSRGKWMVRIQVNGVRKYLGWYPDKLVAARIYRQAAREYHGEFANTKKTWRTDGN